MICDVAKYQGKIDWDKLAPSLDFCIIKASGKTTDPYYARNAAECKRLGIPFHAYHFLYCHNDTQARTEAHLFSNSVGDTKPLFFVLDCEKGWGVDPKKAKALAEEFEAELRRIRGNDIRVALYIGQNVYKEYNLDYSRYAYIWIPGYGEQFKPPYPHDMWQYTSKGKAPGINADVDLNVLTGTKPLSFFTGKIDGKTPEQTEPTKKEGGTTMATKKVPSKVLVAELKAARDRKDGYIMSSRGENPRTGYLDLTVTKVRSSWKENGYYYTQYSGDKKKAALKWRKNCTRVWDCNGMAEGIYEIHTGININTRARHNYAEWCDPKGQGQIPVEMRVPGAAIFFGTPSSDIHHVAYLVEPVKPGHPEGDWVVIEAKGVKFGVVESRLSDRKPDYWGLMTKYYDYNDAEGDIPIPAPVEIHLGDRQLMNGCEGNDVKELQSYLIRLGYDCGRWGADGDFGDATEAAVRKFQTNVGHKVTGIFTAEDVETILKMISGEEAPVEDPKQVVVKGGQCYIRSEPNYTCKKLGVARRDSVHEYAGETTEDGWVKIKYKDGTAWVSGKYAKLVK
jgi:GH25 family lysozyme M1 (1,4-beta-N-acetylmuramidase)